jgi:hypothetical protein
MDHNARFAAIVLVYQMKLGNPTKIVKKIGKKTGF